jgi:hypothetical protein
MGTPHFLPAGQNTRVAPMDMKTSPSNTSARPVDIEQSSLLQRKKKEVEVWSRVVVLLW